MIGHLLLRVLDRLGLSLGRVGHWLRRPAINAQVLANIVTVAIVAAIFSHYLIHRQTIRDHQTRRLDQAVCTVLIAAGPVSRLPPAFQPTYVQAFSDANCQQFVH